MENNYTHPLIKIIEIIPEGMICSSNETLEENEGEW